jgi:hypothetical protein
MNNPHYHAIFQKFMKEYERRAQDPAAEYIVRAYTKSQEYRLQMQNARGWGITCRTRAQKQFLNRSVLPYP